MILRCIVFYISWKQHLAAHTMHVEQFQFVLWISSPCWQFQRDYWVGIIFCLRKRIKTTFMEKHTTRVFGKINKIINYSNRQNISKKGGIIILRNVKMYVNMYKQNQKRWKMNVFRCAKLTDPLLFKTRFPKMNQHTGGKMFTVISGEKWKRWFTWKL